jgi:aspartate aminotransferase, cytoplasmic
MCCTRTCPLSTPAEFQLHRQAHSQHIDRDSENRQTLSADSSRYKLNMAGSSVTVFTKNEVPQAPEDPLFGLMTAYRKDRFDKKVDLGIGAYRDDSAKPWVLPVVKKVHQCIMRQFSAHHLQSRPRRFCEKIQT